MGYKSFNITSEAYLWNKAEGEMVNGACSSAAEPLEPKGEAFTSAHKSHVSGSDRHESFRDKSPVLEGIGARIKRCPVEDSSTDFEYD